MARPIQRGTTRWSLMQVRQAAGITEATARAADRAGLIDATALTVADVALLKVAATLLHTPPPLDGTSRTVHHDLVTARNDLAMRLARQSVSTGVPEDFHLVLFPDEVTPASSLFEAASLLSKRPNAVAVVIPLGRWLADLPVVAAAS